MSTGHDDWCPGASLETLKIRAQILQRIRAFFDARGVFEVETPYLSVASANDPNLHSFSLMAQGDRRYLHTSPELAMKRLLASGSGDIYQLCKVFREHESGRFHNPEFTLLEWYRLGFDHHRLMIEVDALLNEVLCDFYSLQTSLELSYLQVFEDYAGFNPHSVTELECEQIAAKCGISVNSGLDMNAWLDLFISQVISPALPQDRLTFIYDYPATQAAMAKIRDDIPPVAERFEVYLGGLELANGFHELTNASEQRQRLECENVAREAIGLPVIEIDKRFLEALESGLPDCAGVALGIDRLVMLATDMQHIDQVTAFSWSRA